jgi:hypothetical protein
LPPVVTGGYSHPALSELRYYATPPGLSPNQRSVF